MKCDIAFDTTLEQQKPLKLLKTNRLKTRPTINSLGGRFQRNTQSILRPKALAFAVAISITLTGVVLSGRTKIP